MQMARPEGFEPPTTWFEAKYSIQLSYGRKKTLKTLTAPNLPKVCFGKNKTQAQVARIAHVFNLQMRSSIV